ncbi:CHAP domain-containing protein [Thermopolyspora flexuosa]|jgi:hypothetical protein|uniref:CHAP domain-containing protein n=1 Tax=Thermopolyspora flexuosa TaxID=103836 RepID=A0A543IPD3_9ACTN|nr:CHAP domain-containing protein [Thermopolyspora flexuosa]TQM72430.1 CHAP domain-containing protein [Thermopolyspora flexuosa]
MSQHTDALLKIAESQLGYGEGPGGHTKFGQWYQNTHAKEPGYSNAAWCDMFVSWAATQAGLQDAVGQYAWTVEHAKWFESKGAFGDKPVPGAIVFFDWDGSDEIDAIDHVGLVKEVLSDGTIKTIEGNISNAVVSKIRSDATIVGYGYPEVVRQQNQRKTVLVSQKKKAEEAAGSNAARGSSETTTSTSTATPAPAAEHEGIMEPLTVSALLLPALIAAAVVKKSSLGQRLAARLAPARTRRDDSG